MHIVSRQTGFVHGDALRLGLSFDPALLAADLAAIAHAEWIRHLVPQNYDGDWSVLPLRSAAGATHPVMMIYADAQATEFEDGPLLGVTPYFQHVLASLACEIQTARLMRLTPGSVIKEHRDYDLAAEWGSARLHIPVVTNPDVDFRLNGRRVEMAPGEVWYLRLSDPHSVANRGTADRVHLVIDCTVNPWLDAVLTAGSKDVGRPIACA